MNFDGRRRLLALAALLPLVLMSVSGGRASWFRCQLTGAVSDHPCCPDETSAEGDAGATPATVAGVDCCLRETVSFARPPAEAPLAPAHEDGAIATVAGELDPVPAPPSLVNFVRAAQPDIVPLAPLRLVKRSLLI
jgi:hypothetical protein